MSYYIFHIHQTLLIQIIICFGISPLEFFEWTALRGSAFRGSHQTTPRTVFRRGKQDVFFEQGIMKPFER